MADVEAFVTIASGADGLGCASRVAHDKLSLHSSKALRSSEERDAGQWWVPEEIGRQPQKDDMPCRSGTAQGKQREQRCKSSPERTNRREETLEGPGMQTWN
jgi:hypothetical protein